MCGTEFELMHLVDQEPFMTQQYITGRLYFVVKNLKGKNNLNGI
jgi:hypothetical protein